MGNLVTQIHSELSNPHRALVSSIENAGERRWISQKP
jgi:hypothetical protein